MKQTPPKQLSTLMYGLLKGTKSNPERLRDDIKQVFLCECCDGRGWFQDYHDNFSTSCKVCNGTGRIKLKFGVQVVPLMEGVMPLKESE